MVFQHVGHEILGTLDPLLKSHGFRIRYLNFGRHPEIVPTLEKYNGLVILGGPMSVNDTSKYTHIIHELKAIEFALSKNIPVLGICLGAQMIARVLGSDIRKNQVREIGWYDVSKTDQAEGDLLIQNFNKSEKIFQWHGDTFDIPRGAVHLAQSVACDSQAFKYGDKTYGFQFHLEVDEAMIHRWLKIPANKLEMDAFGFQPESIVADTNSQIQNSLKLSRATFSSFIELFGKPERRIVLGSGHGKS